MVVVSETSITEEGETLIFKAADEGGSITMVDAAVSGVEEEVCGRFFRYDVGMDSNFKS